MYVDKLGDSSQINVNGYQQIFTCTWGLEEGGGWGLKLKQC